MMLTYVHAQVVPSSASVMSKQASGFLQVRETWPPPAKCVRVQESSRPQVMSIVCPLENVVARHVFGPPWQTATIFPEEEVNLEFQQACVPLHSRSMWPPQVDSPTRASVN